jgi:hypothetical protein
MSVTNLLILILAVWRISSLLVNEDGPFSVFGRLRHRLGVRYDEYSQPYGENEVAKALTCTWCTSVWVSFVLAALYAAAPTAVLVCSLPFALSAGAIVVDGVIHHG